MRHVVAMGKTYAGPSRTKWRVFALDLVPQYWQPLPAPDDEIDQDYLRKQRIEQDLANE